MRLYVVEGWTASDRAVEVLKAAGIQFDLVSVKEDAGSLSGYRDEFGITIFPTLTMFGYCYEGLAAIKTFAEKETESRRLLTMIEGDGCNG